MFENTFFPLWKFISQNYGSFLEIIIILLLTGASSYVISFVYRKLLPKLKKSRQVWDDALAIALNQPLKYAIWLNGLALLANSLIERYSTHPALFSFIHPVRIIGTVFFVVWAFTHFIRRMEKNYLTQTTKEQDRMDKTTVRALSQIVRLAGISIAGLIAIQACGIPLSGVIAFGGVGGIAIGFAAKDLLANFFGGLMIFLDRPFAIGDWIRSPDRDIEGIVEYIGWRLTRIRTFDKRPLYVPNGLFSTIAIENPSRMQNRRIKATIGLRYEDSPKIERILQEIEEMLCSHPEIDQTKTTFVNLVKFAPYSLEFLIYTLTKTTNWVKFQQVQQDVLLKVLEIIENNGAKCAFPTTTVDLPEDAPLPIKKKLKIPQPTHIAIKPS